LPRCRGKPPRGPGRTRRSVGRSNGQGAARKRGAGREQLLQREGRGGDNRRAWSEPEGLRMVTERRVLQVHRASISRSWGILGPCSDRFPCLLPYLSLSLHLLCLHRLPRFPYFPLGLGGSGRGGGTGLSSASSSERRLSH
jgi:hypothetical protein